MLTVGHNVPLAARLHLNLDKHAVLQGYKTDPERLMGIAAPLIAQCSLTSVRDTIQREFGTCEIFHGTQDPPPELTAVAIVNAFNPEMINRVTNLAMHEGWIIDASNLSSVLYLTGQARDTGLEAAKSCSLSVACVGHRAAEEWGIRFLAMQLRDAFPDGQVIEIFEDEELSAERREIRATPR
jgi:putative NIF3 family GTP cyclohydrolase 1 type 2